MNNDNLKSFVILPGHKHGKYSYPDLLVSIDRRYFSKKWHETHDALNDDGYFMLNLRQFIDFLILLKSGNVQYGDGELVNQSELKKIIDEVTGSREPWRAEWLDTMIQSKDSDFIILEKNKKIEPLDLCLMERGIKVDISTFNNQGMPTKYGDDLYYYCPDRNNTSVIQFGVNSDKIMIEADSSPFFYHDSLGVRPTKIK